MKNKRILIYGGAFDPPHCGHIDVIKILSNLNFDKFFISPSADRHDKTTSSKKENRIDMLKLILKNESFKLKPEITRLEIDKEKSTTFDFIQDLKKNYPDSELFFSVGSDVVLEIKDKWYKGEELFHNTNFIVLDRGGYDIEDKENFPSNFHFIYGDPRQVSSSKIRKKIKETGKSDLIPDYILDYIKDNNLYV